MEIKEIVVESESGARYTLKRAMSITGKENFGLCGNYSTLPGPITMKKLSEFAIKILKWK